MKLGSNVGNDIFNCLGKWIDNGNNDFRAGEIPCDVLGNLTDLCWPHTVFGKTQDQIFYKSYYIRMVLCPSQNLLGWLF